MFCIYVCVFFCARAYPEKSIGGGQLSAIHLEEGCGQGVVSKKQLPGTPADFMRQKAITLIWSSQLRA